MTMSENETRNFPRISLTDYDGDEIVFEAYKGLWIEIPGVSGGIIWLEPKDAYELRDFLVREFPDAR